MRVHPEDRRLARHPYRYRPSVARIPYLLTHPGGIPVIGRMAAAGALAVRGVDAEASLPSGGVLDVPGRPAVVHTPGHTDGHCAFFFATRGVLLSGDALEATEAGVVLTGHGDPWTSGIASAARRARVVGPH